MRERNSPRSEASPDLGGGTAGGRYGGGKVLLLFAIKGASWVFDYGKYFLVCVSFI